MEVILVHDWKSENLDAFISKGQRLAVMETQLDNITKGASSDEVRAIAAITKALILELKQAVLFSRPYQP
jgi:hypothetical protein